MSKHLKSDARRYANKRARCSACLTKDEEIYRLREKVHRLEADKRALQQKLQEGYFGSSTPSSRKPFKPNSALAPVEKKNGGAQLGHRGHGRSGVPPHEADVVQLLETDTVCPTCGVALENLGDQGPQRY
jgi:transposase